MRSDWLGLMRNTVLGRNSAASSTMSVPTRVCTVRMSTSLWPSQLVSGAVSSVARASEKITFTMLLPISSVLMNISRWL